MHQDGRVVPTPITIDVAKIMATSALAGDDVFGPLPPSAKKLIDEIIDQQKEVKRKGALLPTNQVITGAGHSIIDISRATSVDSAVLQACSC